MSAPPPPSSSTGVADFKILLRSKTDVELYSPSTGARTPVAEGATTFHALAPSGSALLLHSASSGVAVYGLSPDGSVADGPTTLPDTLRVLRAWFSPRGSYVATWEKPQKGGEAPNLVAWDARDGTALWKARTTAEGRDGEPLIQWTGDERRAAVRTGERVRVFSGDFSEGAGSWTAPGMRSASLRPTAEKGGGDVLHFASFVPEAKGKPARVALHRYDAATGTETTVTSKSFYRTEEASVSWCPSESSPPWPW